MDPFEQFFKNKSKIALRLHKNNHHQECYTLLTTTLESLSQIWLKDFKEDKKQIIEEQRTIYPEDKIKNAHARLAITRLLKKFAPHAPYSKHVSVIMFAEDWRRNIPEDANIANSLLNKRISTTGALPDQSQDITAEELIAEITSYRTIDRKDILADIIERYEYGALVYKLYRCPLVHNNNPSKLTHGFVQEDEIRYMYQDINTATQSFEPQSRPIRIGFGPKIISKWIDTISEECVKLFQDKTTPRHKVTSKKEEYIYSEGIWGGTHS